MVEVRDISDNGKTSGKSPGNNLAIWAKHHVRLRGVNHFGIYIYSFPSIAKPARR